MYEQSKVEKANELLKLLKVDLHLYIRGSRLRGRSSAYTFKPWDGEIRLAGAKNWIRYPPISGGTINEITSQVIRWVRDMPRRPLRSWEYFWTHQLDQRWDGEAISEFVKANGVAGEDKCVVPGCGNEGTGDWWHQGRVSGPCCRWNRCKGQRLGPLVRQKSS